LSLPTLRDLLAGTFPANTRVLAGAAGLDRTVSWVVVLRPRPPALPPLRGGELALVSLAALRRLEPPLTLKHAVERLAGRGVSGIAVLGEPDEAGIAAADAFGLPLLVLPDDTNLPELQGEITHVISERRTLLFNHGIEIQRRLTELAIAGRGVDAVVRALADLTGRTALLQDETLRVVEVASAGGHAPDAVQALQPDDAGGLLRAGQPLRASDPPTARLEGANGLARWVALVIVDGAVVGYLSLVGPTDALGELDRLAVSQAATACAYQIARERAVAAAEERVRGEFLGDLLESLALTEEAALERGRYLGYDLSGPHVGLVFADDRPAVAGRPAAMPGWRAVAAMVQRAFGGQIPWLVRRERLIILCPAGEGVARAAAVAEEARQRAAALRGVAVSAGLGREQRGLSGLRQSVREAEQALAIAQHLLGGNQTAPFDRLGVFRLLFALHGSAELEAFHDELLSPVVAYDERHNADLVHTLEVLFAQGGNLQRAAEALYVHRNTLAYRLRRVEELTGLRLDDPEAALRMHLALKIHRILVATRAGRGTTLGVQA
jgi:purine catabolism regulator